MEASPNDVISIDGGYAYIMGLMLSVIKVIPIVQLSEGMLYSIIAIMSFSRLPQHGHFHAKPRTLRSSRWPRINGHRWY